MKDPKALRRDMDTLRKTGRPDWDLGRSHEARSKKPVTSAESTGGGGNLRHEADTGVCNLTQNRIEDDGRGGRVVADG